MERFRSRVKAAWDKLPAKAGKDRHQEDSNERRFLKGVMAVFAEADDDADARAAIEQKDLSPPPGASRPWRPAPWRVPPAGPRTGRAWRRAWPSPDGRAIGRVSPPPWRVGGRASAWTAPLAFGAAPPVNSANWRSRPIRIAYPNGWAAQESGP